MPTEAIRKSMQSNRSKDTKPELIVRMRLREAGLLGYRLHWKAPGRPDICWPGKKVAIFVNGCFWHRCPHCKPQLPKTNREWWLVKLDTNVERDKKAIEQLKEQGWRIHTIWECELKKTKIDSTFEALIPVLKQELNK